MCPASHPSAQAQAPHQDQLTLPLPWVGSLLLFVQRIPVGLAGLGARSCSFGGFR
jgi:hypothetical protein